MSSEHSEQMSKHAIEMGSQSRFFSLFLFTVKLNHANTHIKRINLMICFTVYTVSLHLLFVIHGLNACTLQYIWLVIHIMSSLCICSWPQPVYLIGREFFFRSSFCPPLVFVLYISYEVFSRTHHAYISVRRKCSQDNFLLVLLNMRILNPVQNRTLIWFNRKV